jgi:hypothetical protein
VAAEFAVVLTDNKKKQAFVKNVSLFPDTL